MVAAKLVDLVAINILSNGTGALSLGTAVEGYRGKEVLQNGAVYSYAIQQGGNYEYGTGTYLSASSQMLRSPIASSTGGTPINLQPGAYVALVALAEDIYGPIDVLNPLTGEGAPDISVGQLGQVYFDIAAPALYGPKTTDGWGDAIALTGPTGPTGPANNTVVTVADLQAAATTNKSAILAAVTLSTLFGWSSTAPDTVDNATVVSATGGGYWLNLLTTEQVYPTAQPRGTRPGGTDSMGIHYFMDAIRGSMFMGGVDTTPQNDEGGFWAPISGAGPEGIGHTPRPRDQGVYSVGLGRNSLGYQDYSYAFGHDSITFGVASMAGGAGSVTGDYTHPTSGVASFLGYCSFAWGKVVQALGQSAAAFGERCIASGRSAMALGYKAIAQNSLGAIALGNDVQTSASTVTTGGGWSGAIGEWLRNSGDGASNFGRGVNPGSPSNNQVANSLGLGVNVLEPTMRLMPGASGDSYTGWVGSRAGWASLLDNGATTNFRGGAFKHLLNNGVGPMTQVSITGIVSGSEVEFLGVMPNGTVNVRGTQILAARQAAITLPSGGTTIDTQARTAIASLISTLQAHGLTS